MAKKAITKDLNGNIINMLDETNGGYIIRNRQIVNQDRWNEILKKEEDRKLAAQAILHQRVDPDVSDRSKLGIPASEALKNLNNKNMVNNSKLEERVSGLESKLDNIIKLLENEK